jgi:hypothetical protein
MRTIYVTAQSAATAGAAESADSPLHKSVLTHHNWQIYRRRTYHTILKLAYHSLFKMVWYVLLRPLRPELDGKDSA